MGWCLMGTAAHLLDTQAWVGMLSCAADALVDGGTLVVELPHPKEAFLLENVTVDAWKVQNATPDGGVLKVTWGDEEEDTFDAISQLRQRTVLFELEEKG